MASSSVFIGTPKAWQAALATANTNRDGVTGTYVDLVAAGAAPGTRVDRVRIQAAGSTTAGVIRLFVSDGTNVMLLREILVPAITPSTAIEAWSQEVTLNLVLANGWTLRASTHNAEAFKAFAFGGNFV
jgi:hypothetical protein